MPVNSLLQIRKGTASQWTQANPILSSGEPGYDITNNILKIGDGVSNWTTLNSHKHNVSDINSFASGVADTINTEMVGGSGISLTYNSQNNTVTISITGIVSGGGGGSSGPVTVADITDFNTGVSGLIENIYAPLSGPVFTGVPIVPTANSGSNDNQIANTKFVRNEIASVINSAPEALDTLYELAGALGNDSNFATTITNTLSNKASLSGAIFTGAVTIPSGSVDATTLSVTGVPVSVSGHTHSISDILDFDTSVDAKFDTNVVGGSGILLSFDSNTQTLSINALNTGISLSNTDSLPEGSSNLYFTALRASGASPVQSVAGKTGVITLSKSDVGLGNVDNTSDTNKPISLAVQSGLDLKAALSHTHTILDVFGLETSLNEKQPSGNYAVLNSSGNFTNLSVNNTGVSLSGHTHSYSDITNFSSGVASSVNTELVGGSGISLDYNSSTNTVNISVTGIVGGGGISGPIYTTGIVDFNTGVSGLLTEYAPLNSPALTGTPIAPTAPTGTNSNQIASTEFVRNEIANLVASAPSTLDTLNEIALSLNNDASFSSTIVSGLASKASLSGASFTGSVAIPSGSINANILTVDNIPVSVSGHTHIASNISGLDTAIEDKFDTSIAAGSGISLTYDSGNSTLTISVTGLSGGGGTSGPISTSDITDFNSGVSGLLGDYALTSGKLNQFSTTTSSEFSTTISDAAGSGLVVLNDSPTLTGIPLAPTAPSGTNNNQIATTEFVQSSIDNYASSGSFTLPVASDTVLGGIKVGSGLTISSGVLSVTGGGGGSLSGSVTIPESGDPQWANTVLLLKGDGNLTDSSSYGRTVTAYGNAAATGAAKFGSASFTFDGDGDYLQAAASSDFSLSGGDYAIEFWLRPTTLSLAQIIGNRSSNGLGFEVLLSGTGTLFIQSSPSSGASGQYVETPTGTVTTNTWHHVVIARAGSTTRLYVNGALQASGTVNISDNASDPLRIGSNGTARFFAGAIDDLRITRNSSRGYSESTITVPTATYITGPYIAAQTLPVTITGSGGGGSGLTWSSVPASASAPGTAGQIAYDSNYLYVATGTSQWKRTALKTWPLDPYFSNVTLLLHMDGSGSSFIDSSESPKVVTAFGDVVQSTQQSRFGAKSAYFDGDGDYLDVPLSSALQFGTGDFTIEWWLYLIARDSNGSSIWNNYSSFTSGALGFFAGHFSGSTTKYQVACNGTFPAIQSTSSVTYNQWDHFALVRSGNTMTLYINGTPEGSVSVGGVILDGVSSTFRIGRAQDAPTNYELNGYLDEFRITKGVARIITVPTEAFPDA